jgi:PKD repeat protein
VETDSDGIAKATLRSDGRPGTAAVTASSGAAASKTVEVVIGGTALQPTASFQETVGDSLTVLFTDTSTGNPSAREWRFGDGTVSNDRDPVHTYAQAGTYVVTLRVSNPDGEDTASKTITVPRSEAAAPVANFTPVVAGLQVTFTDNSTGTVTSWDWNFGDGTRSTVQHPVHVYAEPGIYSVTLTVSNAAGSSTASRSVAVPTSQVPDADFEFREIAGQEVLFRDTSKNEPTSWAWTFGDGMSSSVRNPSHVYTKLGTYTVTLTASNLAGSSTETKFVTVRGPLKADFTFVPKDLTVAFSNISSGSPTTFLWTFGDNTAPATVANPEHTYAKAGIYTVTLTVTRPEDSDSPEEQSSMSHQVEVKEPTAKGSL